MFSSISIFLINMCMRCFREVHIYLPCWHPIFSTIHLLEQYWTLINWSAKQRDLLEIWRWTEAKVLFCFVFSISNIGNSSRGLLRITAGNCGIRSPSLRNMSRVGSWETTQCINTVPTVAAEGATPPSSNSASNVLSWPPALGGNSFVIWGKQPFLP